MLRLPDDNDRSTIFAWSRVINNTTNNQQNSFNWIQRNNTVYLNVLYQQFLFFLFLEATNETLLEVPIIS